MENLEKMTKLSDDGSDPNVKDRHEIEDDFEKTTKGVKVESKDWANEASLLNGNANSKRNCDDENCVEMAGNINSEHVERIEDVPPTYDSSEDDDQNENGHSDICDIEESTHKTSVEIVDYSVP